MEGNEALTKGKGKSPGCTCGKKTYRTEGMPAKNKRKKRHRELDWRRQTIGKGGREPTSSGAKKKDGSSRLGG